MYMGNKQLENSKNRNGYNGIKVKDWRVIF